MKNGPLFFLGLFLALTLSWGGTVLLSNHQLGGLTAYFDDSDSAAYPLRPPGIAVRGQLVYADLGCASCHTQAVRRPDFGGDQARGWGERQSVARDYIFQSRVQLGQSRIGPDLANLAGRKAPYDPDELTNFLYTGIIPGTKTVTHPAYKFLFDERAITGQRSAKALTLPGNLASAAGREIVPSERAQTLVAYLLSLNNSYEYPEAKPMTLQEEKKEGAAAKVGAPAAKQEGEKK